MNINLHEIALTDEGSAYIRSMNGSALDFDKAIDSVSAAIDSSTETVLIKRIDVGITTAVQLGLSKDQIEYVLGEIFDDDEKTRFLVEQVVELRMAETPSLMSLLAEFHATFISDGVTRADRLAVRPTLIREEAAEAIEALEAEPFDIAHLAQELSDVIYVALGTGLEHGIDLDAGVREVHRANMSKLDANGQPIFREDGKVLKSDLYTPPNMVQAEIIGGDEVDRRSS